MEPPLPEPGRRGRKEAVIELRQLIRARRLHAQRALDERMKRLDLGGQAA
jgi:hypothetical protein